MGGTGFFFSTWNNWSLFYVWPFRVTFSSLGILSRTFWVGGVTGVRIAVYRGTLGNRGYHRKVTSEHVEPTPVKVVVVGFNIIDHNLNTRVIGVLDVPVSVFLVCVYVCFSGRRTLFFILLQFFVSTIQWTIQTIFNNSFVSAFDLFFSFLGAGIFCL